MELSDGDVREILALLDGLPFDEFDLRTERFRLVLRRTAEGEWTQAAQVLSPPDPLPPPAPRAEASPVGDSHDCEARSVSAEVTPGGGGTEVRAPLPGTFYRAPRPGAAPFVEVGSHVGEETIVGIIETMKLMNSVCAGVCGTIAEILIADAQFAPQDSALMRVREEL